MVAVLGVGALIYYSPKRLSPEQSFSEPASDSTSDTRYATLSVYSRPAGASVIVGADTVGVTPIRDHRVPVGTYLVSVSKEDYVDRDTAMTLAAHESAVYVSQLSREAELQSADQGGPRELSTTEDFGTDPTQDRQRAEVANQEPNVGGSSGASQEQAPSSGPSGEGDVEALVTGSLELRSDPGSTAVEINGYGVGSTPMRLDQVAAGTHEITFSHPGYATLTKRVEVAGNDTVQVEASLETLTGHLRVLVRPWGSIYINGQRRAEDSDVWYETELQAGTYTVIARHPSLGEQVQAVEVAPSDTQSVVLNMRAN